MQHNFPDFFQSGGGVGSTHQKGAVHPPGDNPGGGNGIDGRMGASGGVTGGLGARILSTGAVEALDGLGLPAKIQGLAA